MKTSICMSTRNQAEALKLTLKSIRAQKVSFEYEVIVADDGSTDSTKDVCTQYAVNYIHLDNTRYRNPAIARNAAYRAAKGDIVISQSSEVIHHTDVITCLTNLQPNELLFATVYDFTVGNDMTNPPVYCGPQLKKPYFFLGSLWRKDIYAIGGNDENFVEIGFDDDWFCDCLIKGLGRVPKYAPEAIGWHQAHERDFDLSRIEVSRQLYLRNCARGDWTNKPWEYK